MWSSSRRSLSWHLSKIVYSAVVSLFISIPLHAESKADHVIVHKQARTMALMRTGQVIKTYKIALGGEPVGLKTRQGDHRTPEGLYVIDSRNAHSQFLARYIFLIPTLPIENAQENWACHPAEIYTFTACRMAMASSALRIAPAIGLTAASPSPIRKSKRFGAWWTMARR